MVFSDDRLTKLTGLNFVFYCLRSYNVDHRLWQSEDTIRRIESKLYWAEIAKNVQTEHKLKQEVAKFKDQYSDKYHQSIVKTENLV